MTTNDYPVDPNSGVELHRLYRQDALMTERVSGYLPPNIHGSQVHTILDLGCGPGAWLIEMARRHSHLHCSGIDISEHMIAYAQNLAKTEPFHDRLRFSVGSFDTLPFPDATFDFVNARNVQWFLASEGRDSVAQEWYRVLRPGGWLRFIGIQVPFTNSAAFETITELFLGILGARGKTLSLSTCSPEAQEKVEHLRQTYTPFLSNIPRDIGVVVELRGMLEHLDCEEIQVSSHVIDFSYNSEDREAWVRNMLLSHESYKPFFLNEIAGLSQQHLETLYAVSREELASPTFLGIEFFLSVWGKKPL